MSRTASTAGLAVAVYIEDGQGRRLAVVTPGVFPPPPPVVLATTKAEARAAIAALRQLAEELPP